VAKTKLRLTVNPSVIETPVSGYHSEPGNDKIEGHMSNRSQVKPKRRRTSYYMWRFAREYGYRMMYFVTIFFVAILIGVLVGLVLGDIQAGLVTYLFMFMFLQPIAYLGIVVYSRSFAGHIVKDFGKSSLWFLYLACLALFIPFFYLLPQMSFMRPKVFPSVVLYLFVFLFCCSSFLMVLTASLGRLQLRQKGINLYGLFVAWDWIKSYSWEWGGRRLYLKGKNQIFHYAFLSGPFWIASKHRDIVDELLKKHIGPETPG
jgi:hypothetical protein